MPVITVTAAPLESGQREGEALRALCRAVAGALSLQPSDVYAALVPASVAVLGDERVEPWPIVALHGRTRPNEQLASARDAAVEVIAGAWDCDAGAVWAQWLLTD